MGLSGGVFGSLMNLVFGNERNVLAETVEVFRANAEKTAARDAQATQAALEQFAAEFARPRKSLFDAVIDGMNRIPRPAMALGTIALFVAAMLDPVWFAERMQGIALVPEPLWWLLGAIVSFYFGARHQAKTQEFNRSIAETLSRTPEVVQGLGALRALDGPAGAPAGTGRDDVEAEPAARARGEGAQEAPASRQVRGAGNPALAEWGALNG